MSEEHEKAIHSKSTLKTIRTATDANTAPELRAAVISSINAPIATLTGRFSRLKLLDEKFIELETKDDEAAAIELGARILQVSVCCAQCVRLRSWCGWISDRSHYRLEPTLNSNVAVEGQAAGLSGSSLHV